MEKWKAAIRFLNFVAADGMVVDMLRLCEESRSLSMWGTKAYPGRENRLLYTSEAPATHKVDLRSVG